jgi:hypothetical protein
MLRGKPIYCQDCYCGNYHFPSSGRPSLLSDVTRERINTCSHCVGVEMVQTPKPAESGSACNRLIVGATQLLAITEQCPEKKISTIMDNPINNQFAKCHYSTLHMSHLVSLKHTVLSWEESNMNGFVIKRAPEQRP